MQSDSIYTLITTSVISVSGIFFTYLASKRNNWNSGVIQFRQQWLNNLRNALSLFIAKAETISLTHYDDDEPYFEHFTELSQSYNKVVLLLNPSEDDHNQIVDQIVVIRELVHLEENEIQSDEEFDEQMDKEIDALLDVCQKVLKKEWNVIKLK